MKALPPGMAYNSLTSCTSACLVFPSCLRRGKGKKLVTAAQEEIVGGCNTSSTSTLETRERNYSLAGESFLLFLSGLVTIPFCQPVGNVGRRRESWGRSCSNWPNFGSFGQLGTIFPEQHSTVDRAQAIDPQLMMNAVPRL